MDVILLQYRNSFLLVRVKKKGGQKCAFRWII